MKHSHRERYTVYTIYKGFYVLKYILPNPQKKQTSAIYSEHSNILNKKEFCLTSTLSVHTGSTYITKKIYDMQLVLNVLTFFLLQELRKNVDLLVVSPNLKLIGLDFCLLWEEDCNTIVLQNP